MGGGIGGRARLLMTFNCLRELKKRRCAVGSHGM